MQLENLRSFQQHLHKTTDSPARTCIHNLQSFITFPTPQNRRMSSSKSGFVSVAPAAHNPYAPAAILQFVAASWAIVLHEDQQHV